MGVFSWIGRFFGALWNFSRASHADVGMGLRPGSGASTLYIFLFLLLFLVGLGLVLLGFDLGDVDRWIDAQGGWLEAVGSVLFRIVCGLVLLICVAMVGFGLFDRKSPDRPGWGCLLGAVVVGYLAWIGVMGA